MRRFNPDGNARLTAVVGLVLLGLTVVELGTLLFGLQHFLTLHVFVGLVLLPPIAAKLAVTGWRFMRYYTRNDAYVDKGAPHVVMRLLAPLLVALTAVLFGSGVAMGLVHGSALQVARQLHGPAAFLWTVVLGVHVLVYLPRAVRHVRPRVAPFGFAALAAGLALGIAAVPGMHRWTHLHGHDDRGAVTRR